MNESCYTAEGVMSYRVPDWGRMGDLLKAGFAVQLRTVAMNAVFIAGAGNIQVCEVCTYESYL